ncbi:MAG: ABC transporter ATP-binding protein [Anaerolineae bacterium]|nr:ABC transporter ATP-binding protein [Anaerolineae bacterium]
MIQLENLTKRFDGFTAVDCVTLAVDGGEILALLGPNGAGKTTTVRMLAAVLQPTEGRAVVAGFDTRQQPIAVRARVGILTEQPGLYLRMRGGEYLHFFGRIYGLDRETRERQGRRWLQQFAMPEAWERRMGEFSKGMRQKMALARTLLHDPPVLLLDEPTSAMDPYSAKLVRDAILTLRDDRRAILLCTHNLAEAEIVADRIAIIRRGEIVALGTPAELKRRLLGPPLMELRLAGAVDGALPVVARFVQPQARGPDWLRYQVADPAAVNPPLLRALAEADIAVVSLGQVEQSLESVYLQVVGEA